MTNNFSIPLICVFCDKVLEGDVEIEYKDGDLITCQNCGMDNDYTSLLKIVEEKVVKALEDEITISFKNILK